MITELTLILCGILTGFLFKFFFDGAKMLGTTVITQKAEGGNGGDGGSAYSVNGDASGGGGGGGGRSAVMNIGIADDKKVRSFELVSYIGLFLSLVQVMIGIISIVV